MRRSSRATCGHGDNDPMYLVWPPKGEQPSDPAVDVALQHLASVLNALPGPLEDAIAEVAPHDIGRLLSRAPLEGRTHALLALGLPRMTPRVVGPALSRDV